MSQYLLSSQAQQSLIQISQYTLENFGPRQKKSYLRMLRDRMRAAAKNPEKGRQRSEIKAGYRKEGGQVLNCESQTNFMILLTDE